VLWGDESVANGDSGVAKHNCNNIAVGICNREEDPSPISVAFFFASLGTYLMSLC
jgi:hypothetical protein